MSEKWAKFAKLVLRPDHELKASECEFVAYMLNRDLPRWVQWRTRVSPASAEEIVSTAIERYVRFAQLRPEAQTPEILRRNFDWVILSHLEDEGKQTRERVDLPVNLDGPVDAIDVVADYCAGTAFDDYHLDLLHLARMAVRAAVQKTLAALEHAKTEDLLVVYQLYVDELCHDPTRNDDQILRNVRESLRDQGVREKEVRNLCDRFKRNKYVHAFFVELGGILPGR